jgi:hypothetical protein
MTERISWEAFSQKAKAIFSDALKEISPESRRAFMEELDPKDEIQITRLMIGVVECYYAHHKPNVCAVCGHDFSIHPWASTSKSGAESYCRICHDNWAMYKQMIFVVPGSAGYLYFNPHNLRLRCVTTQLKRNANGD